MSVSHQEIDIKPVFSAACYLRHRNPAVSEIVQMTHTKLNMEVVAAILEGALRLLPPDNTPEGRQMRRQKEQEKAEHARKAEDDFVEQIRQFQPAMLDETEQKQQISAAQEAGNISIVRATPDVLFIRPTEINGIICHWIEYKNSFGFKQNPFVQQKIKKQCRTYASLFGPGIIVYKLGFEELLLNIEGVYTFREREVLLWVGRQSST